jgi:hypothetical protein
MQRTPRDATGAYPTREAFKAFSQNIGHSVVITTVSAYCPVSVERQAEMIRAGQRTFDVYNEIVTARGLVQ